MNPFADDPAASIAPLGEAGLLARIREWLGPAMPPAPFGMGDDCAVLPHPPGNLLTTDSLLYRCHFDDSAAPEAAGAKLLKRNLSDIAAMGGRPTVAVMAAFLPPQTALAWLEGFVRGMGACARAYDTLLVGGDLTQGTGDPAFTLTLLGQAERPLPRTGARPGDRIYVTGELGGSLAGHHLDFVPRLAEGRWLAARPEAVSCIDVTDGLAKDLPALLDHGLAAAINPDRLPLREAVGTIARRSGRAPWEHALGDGEDYELLFTLRADTASAAGFESTWRNAFATRLTCIGEIVTTQGPPAIIDGASGEPLGSDPTAGYRHFR